MYWNTPLTLSARLVDLIGAVCRVIGLQTAWGRADVRVVALIQIRLMRWRTRVMALADKVRAGTLPAKAVARPRAATPRPADKPDKPEQPRLPPQRFGWILRAVPEPWHVAFWRGPLEELLADPETIALVAAAPQAGRYLRPMCWSLAVELPEYLRRPRPARPLTPEQRDARSAKMGRMAWARFVNPEDEGEHDPRALRPPNRIGYGRSKPLIKRDPY
jgi:hypothetical protein